MNDVQQYINQRRAEGYTEAQIADNLRIAGWPDAEIARLLSPQPIQRPKRSFLSRTNTLFTVMAVVVLIIGLFLVLALRENQDNEGPAEQSNEQVVEEPASEEELVAVSQRDTDRRNDILRVVAALEISAANTNGQYPESLEDFQAALTEYSSSELTDPSTQNGYTFVERTPERGELQYGFGKTCESPDDFVSNRSFFLAIRLEADGLYCADNR